MDLKYNDIIFRPRATGKAYTLNQKLKKLVLEVHPHATKPMIVRALKKLFNADVEKIGIINVAAKQRRVSGRLVMGKSKKKAIITLKAGSVDTIMNWMSFAQGPATAINTYKAD